MSYSPIVLDHFYNPRNNYVMKDPDAVGVAGESGHGNFMVIYLRTHGDLIEEANSQTHGCCPSIAAGSFLTSQLRGASLASAGVWTEDSINQGLGGLPHHKRNCSLLAASALRAALRMTSEREARR